MMMMSGFLDDDDVVVVKTVFLLTAYYFYGMFTDCSISIYKYKPKLTYWYANIDTTVININDTSD